MLLFPRSGLSQFYFLYLFIIFLFVFKGFICFLFENLCLFVFPCISLRHSLISSLNVPIIIIRMDLKSFLFYAFGVIRYPKLGLQGYMISKGVGLACFCWLYSFKNLFPSGWLCSLDISVVEGVEMWVNFNDPGVAIFDGYPSVV